MTSNKKSYRKLGILPLFLNIFILLSINTKIFSQVSLSSEKKSLSEITKLMEEQIEKYKYTNPKKADSISFHILRYNQYNDIWGTAYNQLGVSAFRAGKDSLAAIYYEKAIECFSTINSSKNKSKLISAKRNLAGAKFYGGDPVNGMEIIYNTIDKYKMSSDSNLTSTLYYTLGVFYFGLDLIEDSSKYLEKARIKFNNTKDSLRVLKTDQMLGNLAIAKGEYYEAILSLKGIESKFDYYDNPADIQSIYIDLSKAFWEIEEYEMSKDYAEKVLEQQKVLRYEICEAISKRILGQYYIEKKDFKKAEKYLIESYYLSRKSNELNELAKVSLLLVNVYNKMFDTDKTSKFYNIYNNVSAEAKQSYSKNIINANKVKFDIQSVQHELKTLKLEININEEIIKSRRLMYLIGLFILILAASILAFVLYKKHQNKMNKLKKNIAMDLHDDIGASLYMMKQKLKKEIFHKNNQIESPEQIYTNLSKNVDSISYSTQDIIWSLDDNLNKGLDLYNKVLDLCYDNDISIESNIDTFSSNMKLNLVQKRNVFLIVKESLNNGLKYGIEDSLKLKFSFVKGGITYTIENEYGTKSKETLSSANGLKNIKSRASSINGEVTKRKTQNKFYLTLKASF